MSTSAQDPVLQSKLAQYRARSSGIGPPLELADYREIIQLLRAGRASAAVTSEAARRKKAKADVPNADDLLDSLT